MRNYRSLTIFYIVFFLLLTNISWSQNIAPVLTAIGNQPYCAKTQINIVTDFNIVDPDDTGIAALFVQVSTGYVSGEDTLLLLNSHPNVVTSWNVLEGKLTLSGVASAPVTYIDLIAAIKDVVFQSTGNNPSDKAFSITIGDANYLPSTGHYYEYVPSLGITWTSAKIAAEARTYFGIPGYLATITSAEEAQLSGKQAAGAGWIGGSDAAVEGVWRWVTGPENGTVFWNGLSNGSTPNFAFWNTNEPNQAGDEDYAHITAPGVGIPGSWNDLSNTGSLINGNAYQPKGYIVEYGGLPGDPVLNISASTKIYTNAITNVKPASICGSGMLTLEATPLYGTVLWFNSATGGIPINTGLTFTTPTLNITTTYYALASLNGCTTGDRTPIIATINQIPTIVSTVGSLICDSGSGTLSATASAGVINWYDVSIGGSVLGTGTTFITPTLNATKTYYIDATLNGCTTLMRAPVTVTVQKTPLPIANASQRFCDIENATVSNLTITGNAVLWYANATGGTPLNNTELLKTNTTYYATQTINTCESANRLAVNVLIDETVIIPATIPVLTACDTMTDGDDTNGLTIFDLTLNETILLNGKAASDYTFFYFMDTAYSIPIPTASNAFVNTIQGGQAIYVRIVNINNNSCFTDTSFNIQVKDLPVIQPSIVFKNCDEDGIPDGFTYFNLEEAHDVITNNNSSGLNFSYYTSYNDADSGNNEIPSIINNQTTSTIFVRVENNNGCHRVATVTLQASTTSFPLGYVEELQSCDDDITSDGNHVFDLTQVSPLFISQFPAGQNLSVHYYKNLNDAQLEQNEILSQTNYINNTPFSEILYVRVESGDNGECFGLGPHLLLTVHPRPEFEVDQTEVYCLDNNPISLFTYNPNGNYTYEWRDANANLVSVLPNATVFSAGIYTVIATSIFGCESFPVTFDVVESAIASIDLDDVTIVELSNNNSIRINNDNNNLGIGDYEFALDAINGPYKDEPYFDRVGAGVHTIYVKDKNKCGIAELEVFILGFPKFFTPNNDGSNDTWNIRGLGTDFTEASLVKIFDRYGKLIKQISGKNDGWDGTFNGKRLPDSDYWFVAQLVEISGNIRTYRGHFSLIR
ncbi:Ig-like domain-containing protein [Mariniflexile sp.]|uniref:Ig-like domain-containing protein n=1 Tax=Mariniflexile sp. TaxID=1979402 RepID=UPI004048DE65